MTISFETLRWNKAIFCFESVQNLKDDFLTSTLVGTPHWGCFFLPLSPVGTHRVQAQPLSLFDLLRVAQIRVFRLNIVGHLATIVSWERERFTVRGIHKEDDCMTWDSG